MGTSVSSVLASSSSSSSSSTDSINLTASDFLQLFVTQMQNQDFNDPLDNSEMMNQITQLSNMQMMQELASYSKSSYVMSLLGKNVTAARFSDSGELETTTGTVSKVSFVDEDYVLYIEGKEYTLSQVMEIQNSSDSSDLLNVSSYAVTATSVTDSTATVGWRVPTEDDAVANNLKYTVCYSQEGPFSTVEEVQAGTTFGIASQSDLLGATINGLDAGQTYYINVLVEDASGKKYVYSPTMITTNK